MSTISMSDARGKLPEVVAAAHGEAVFLERRGKTAAVVISPERYSQFMDALDEAEDARAFDEAMADEGPNIPWDQAKIDLGWV